MGSGLSKSIPEDVPLKSGTLQSYLAAMPPWIFTAVSSSVSSSKKFLVTMQPRPHERTMIVALTDHQILYMKRVSIDELRLMKEAIEEKSEVQKPMIRWYHFFFALTQSFRQSKKRMTVDFVEILEEGTLCKLNLLFQIPSIGKSILHLNLKEVSFNKYMAQLFGNPLYDFYSAHCRQRIQHSFEDEDDVDLKKQIKLLKKKNEEMEERLDSIHEGGGSPTPLDHFKRKSRPVEKMTLSSSHLMIDNEVITFPGSQAMRFIKEYRKKLIDRKTVTESELKTFEKMVNTLTHQGSLIKEQFDENSKETDAEIHEFLKEKFTNKKRRKKKRLDSPMDDLLSDQTLSKKKDAIAKLFNHVDEWTFDVFTLEDTCPEETLSLVMYSLFVKYDLFRAFQISESKLLCFAREVTAGYHSNPYHNARHAADVTQILHVILHKGGLAGFLADEDILASLLAASIHDFDHPGLNNAYQINSQSYLATLYNDRSVLENHHVAHAFELLRVDQFNILENIFDQKLKDIRETIIGMVLATDMAHHIKYISNFSKKVDSDSDFTSKEDIRLSLQVAIKMADVSNPTRPIHLYLQWTHHIIHEFFAQGDREQMEGLPLSPLMDRKSSKTSKGQTAFINYVIEPMFTVYANFLPNMRFVLEYIKNNKMYWLKNSKLPELEDIKKMGIHG